MLEYFMWLPHDWYWSCGKHPEFKWDARVWRKLPGDKQNSIGPKIEIYIGIGDCLEEAIKNCKEKYDRGK